MGQFFYVFDGHTNLIKACKKKGLIPNGEYCISEYSGQIFGVSEFILDDTPYTLLTSTECYLFREIILMALPCLDFEKLIKLLESTKNYDEIIGCVGILLKKHPDDFIGYLFLNQSKSIKKVKKFILEEINYIEIDAFIKKKLKMACETHT